MPATPKQCRTCGGDDHCRRNSSRCPMNPNAYIHGTSSQSATTSRINSGRSNSTQVTSNPCVRNVGSASANADSIQEEDVATHSCIKVSLARISKEKIYCDRIQSLIQSVHWLAYHASHCIKWLFAYPGNRIALTEEHIQGVLYLLDNDTKWEPFKRLLREH